IDGDPNQRWMGVSNATRGGDVGGAGLAIVMGLSAKDQPGGGGGRERAEKGGNAFAHSSLGASVGTRAPFLRRKASLPCPLGQHCASPSFCSSVPRTILP